MQMTENIPSLDEALAVFNSADFRLTLLRLITANETDNVRYRETHVGGSEKRNILDIMSGADATDVLEDTIQETRKVLDTLSDAELYATEVVMYAGRDGDEMLPSPRGRYDCDRIEQEFREWWYWLHMDDEHFAREVIESKWPLCRYLLAGMYMFRIDQRW